ncbi:hypothetical protein ABIB40_003321 [Pedobacter sp. UYP30]|uniref:capsular polysaccharide synthesis protein n=1 Tax=Pedobacter sp. UYP30 TaxID=1756400 RepID=UPI0033937C1F
MMNINNTVNSLWISPIIGELQLLCIQSFLDKGIAFHLYTYNNLQNVPVGVVVKDANTIIAEDKIFLDLKNSFATFSDWFRIKLLHEVGGWWVDCDTFCIKRFNFDAPYVFATEGISQHGARHLCICNAVIKLPAKSKFGEEVLKEIQQKFASKKHEEITWTEIGAQILYKQIAIQKLLEYVKPTVFFCPNDYTNFEQLSQFDNLTFDENTYAVHLWNKMWEWNNIEPLEDATENSFLGKARTRYQKNNL